MYGCVYIYIFLVLINEKAYLAMSIPSAQTATL